MVTESSLLCSQKYATGLYSQPDEYTQNHPILFLYAPL
jgi:hypothetical protein